MSDARKGLIFDEFNAFLDRYSPPRHMQDNPNTMQAEADALLRVLLKFAPMKDYAAWLEEVLEQLSYQMKTRAWPTVGEVRAVASGISKGSVKFTPDPAPDQRDHLEVAADAIRDGMPVGDGYLYGRFAVEMIGRGLIHEDDMRRHRSALYFAAKDVWGEDVALAKERDLKSRHEDAKKRHTGKAGFDAPVPNKRADVSQDQRDEYAAGGW